jgi:SAM-dependent methyltransferase
MQFSEAWRRWRDRVDLDEYETRWDLMAAEGTDVHGEADYVMRYNPGSALDAGCGMGRVGIELAQRGISVTGVDLDPEMLNRAAVRAPEETWIVSNLAGLDLGRTYDVVVMAGNVLPYAEPSEHRQIIASMCAHVGPDGVLVSGSSLWPKWPGTTDYDNWCAENSFVLAERFAAWTLEEFEPEIADYVVSTYRRS